MGIDVAAEVAGMAVVAVAGVAEGVVAVDHIVVVES